MRSENDADAAAPPGPAPHGPAATVLIVDDDRLLRDQIRWSLAKTCRVLEAGSREEGLAASRKSHPDLVIVDLHLPPARGTAAGLGLLRDLRLSGEDLLVIVMTGDERKEPALRAIEEGAYDFFRKPIDCDELRLVIRRALERQRLERENRRLRDRLRDESPGGQILGRSEGIRRVFEAIHRVADSDVTVILRGESGTGKDLVARAIHTGSPRRDGPFVPVQCSALPEHLIESELFGHEKGAFTGAISAHAGRFEKADRGTLFLDEVGTLAPAVQTKLLRVLEQKEFERLGGKQTVRVDVRVISATNEDLEARVRQGAFREDLYYRLNVYAIEIPPLRERRDDIPILVDHFLGLFCRARGLAVKKMDAAALDCLVRAAWKGNVRELENVVQNLVLRTDGDRISPTDLPPSVRAVCPDAARGPGIPAGNGFDLERELDRFEADLLRQALDRAGKIKIEAARLLGIDKNRMMYLCRKHHL